MRKLLLAFFCCCCGANIGHCAGYAKHIVLIVWDGMRPDFVNATNTPVLFEMSQRGVIFQNHHPVYFSSTEVNGTALATGDYPAHSGVIANREFRPDIEANKSIAMESLNAMREGDKVTGGKYLMAPTLAEILQRNGLRTLIAGAKPVVLLHDRAKRADDSENIVLYEGKTLPSNAQPTLTNLFGVFPQPNPTKTNLDNWTTRAATGPLWEKGVPAFTLLWMAEPDHTQHATGPGSRRSLRAIRNSDNNLALVIAALKEKNVFEQTDILVVSDHGFSTISRRADVAGRLQTNGFNASREFKSPPAKGDVLVVGNGGSTLLYVIGHDRKTIKRLVNFLQTQDFVGTIFSRTGERGTFPLSKGLIDSQTAADVAFSMRWNGETNSYGAAGKVISDGGESVPRAGSLTGTHVSLSRFDMHNTLVAAGPDFRSGMKDELPSGNVDVAPTILHIFGIKPTQPMDGRVLTEALTIKGPKAGKPKTKILEAKNNSWRQYLKRTELNGVIYLDEGNAGVPKP